MTTWADIKKLHEDFSERTRRHLESPEYRAYRADLERKREQHRREWLAFAAAGWPASENLVLALRRDR